MQKPLLIIVSIVAFALNAICNELPDDPRLYTAIILGNSGCGSGCILQMSNSMYFLTAKHVLFEEAQGTNAPALRFPTATIKSSCKGESNLLNSVMVTLNLSLLQQDGEVRWSTNRDVALVRIGGPIGTNMGMFMLKGVDVIGSVATVNMTPETMITKFGEIKMGSDAYMLGYPVSLTGPMADVIDPTEPLIRKGIISGIERNHKFIIIDCPAYFGNSGGPVFELERPDPFQTKLRLIGVVSAFIPFQEEWENKTMRYSHVIKSNSGLTMVEPMDFVLPLVWR